MRVRTLVFGSVIVISLLVATAALGENAATAGGSTPTNTAAAGGSSQTNTTSVPTNTVAATQTKTAATADPLLQLLVSKGVIDADEAKTLAGTPGTPEQQRTRLLELLRQKGILSAADFAELAPASAQVEPNLVASASPILAGPQTKEPGPVVASAPPPPGPAVVAAIAPLRVLPVDPPKKDGLNAAFKMGGVKMTPYGFIKATAAYDTSSPNGDDFPFVGLFLTTPQVFDTGPTKDPEFHLKARSTRLGANFEWPDISPKIILTGRVEGDYEGNFSEVDNRDVSSIRSNAFQLRLAWARLDYAMSDKTDIYFEGGQDWTLFGSSVLPNILETTFLGAFYGNIWTRSPQFQFGVVQSLGSKYNIKFAPTFAIMMPSSGQILKLGSLGVQGQLGEAEREGADSGRPEVEGRVAVQWQLDRAKGVAPAQIMVTGFQSRRTSIVPSSSYIGPSGCEITLSYCTAFPNGFTASSPEYGGQFGIQLPTRWFTLVGSLYRGGDLRFFFGGQVNSYATDTGGLTNIQGPFVTLDGGPLTAAGGAVLGTNAAGNVVVAPQRPIRSFGGFINLGLPLSRWFNADPRGHNAGWQLYLDFGKDQVVDRDLNNPYYTANANTLSPLPLAMGKMAALSLYYKLNPYISFGYEQSIYATRLEDHLNLYSIAGQPSNEWQDHRSEFGPIFTF
ncbi:MAG: hypothetical protein WBV46_13820 [Terriglobales bacterium]